MDRYLCIHGHFYQPPRENAWLETIERQESADPYCDWNARIDAECYAPNGMARILDGEGRIARIVNNYARISFDFGPTLLSWLESEAPDTYERVLAADRESAARFSGHGSALAQAYNHMILPLANARDRRTQVRWGVRDFERRFGRRPEGMWLPETAVDIESLELLAEEGIRFTVLAPNQARRFRARGAKEWQEVGSGGIDPSRAYEQKLPSGRTIALFFYDGPISRAIAFERLLEKSEGFVRRLRAGFSEERGGPQLVHVATDGETYGHHHRFGDMALAAALQSIDEDPSIALTNYGEFLERHPPAFEVEIVERSAWSCAHGVGRWSSDCGCSTGLHPGWNQAWRAPLRTAFDWLRDELAPRFEHAAGLLFQDPWRARDEYVDVVLDRSVDRVRAFFGRSAARALSPEEEVRALKLLELQRHAMLMYTSCGWFFDDVAGIEAVQVIQYAARALQLAEELFGEELEPRFLELLAAANSNAPESGDGRRLYEERVKPKRLDLRCVGAHHAVSSLFQEPGVRARVHGYEVLEEERETIESGGARLALGRGTVRSIATWESAPLAWAVVHFGGHELSGGILEERPAGPLQELFADVVEAVQRADLVETLRRIERRFGAQTLSLRSLFRDAQREIIDDLLAERVEEADAAYVGVYQRNAGLMQFLGERGLPVPKALSVAAELAVNEQLERAFVVGTPIDFERVERLLAEARARKIGLDRTHLEYEIRLSLEQMAVRFAAEAEDLERLRVLQAGAELLLRLPFAVDVWRVQNECWRVMQEELPEFRARAAEGDAQAQEWVRMFQVLGARLNMRVQ